MVDFKKKLGLKSIEKKVNPVEIYDVLDRKSETSDLRPVQKEILTDWWLHRKEDKDLILKLHTGQGKTLIGLLMLQSKLNEKKERNEAIEQFSRSEMRKLRRMNHETM